MGQFLLWDYQAKLAQLHLNRKPAKFYNIEKHLKHTLILEVNYASCAHITVCGLIAHQEYRLLLCMKQKLIK